MAGRKPPGRLAAALRGVVLVLGLILAKAGAAGQAALESVRALLCPTGRPSSLVEGIHRVVRMQPARHRRMTQGMLDLKRLSWKSRACRSGQRKGQSPYERLGIRLPEITWWELPKEEPKGTQLEWHFPKT